MDIFRFVILVVAIVTFGQIARLYISSKSSEKGALEENEKHRAQVDGKLEELEERVRVLERIVTDKRDDLKRQIDDL